MYYDYNDYHDDHYGWTLGEYETGTIGAPSYGDYECGFSADSPSYGEYECGCDYDWSDL